MNNLSESIVYGYKLSKNIDVAKRGENIILISENISRFSAKYSDKSFKELCDLKIKAHYLLLYLKHSLWHQINQPLGTVLFSSVFEVRFIVVKYSR